MCILHNAYIYIYNAVCMQFEKTYQSTTFSIFLYMNQQAIQSKSTMLSRYYIPVNGETDYKIDFDLIEYNEIMKEWSDSVTLIIQWIF